MSACLYYVLTATAILFPTLQRWNVRAGSVASPAADDVFRAARFGEERAQSVQPRTLQREAS